MEARTNENQGGTYTRDPKTGKRTLVERTLQPGEEPPAAMPKKTEAVPVQDE